MSDKAYDVCVVGGAGRVGLPLSIAFAEKGLQVLIHDINGKAIDTISRGTMPFREDGAQEMLTKVIGTQLHGTTDPEKIRDSRFVIVTIGTPVDEHLNPTYHVIKRFFAELSPHLSEDQIVILRSTIYPQTTEKVFDLLRRDHPNIQVCFCPERIAEGKAMSELYDLPQIISGFDQTAIDQVAGLFGKLTGDLIFVSPVEAELAKLFNNSWRYLEFAIANQFYTIAESRGADFYKVYHAMTHNYPRAKSCPRPGFAAGPCLFKDTMQISAFAKNTFFLGHSAMLVNEGLPNFLVEQAKKQHPLAKMTAGILGMAFKAENDDKRESLSYKLKKVLEMECAEVLCSDEYIKEEGFVDKDYLVEKCDIVFIGAPHKAYGQMHLDGCHVVDVWNMTNKKSP